MFITFEGVDGCGKTTQMELLARRLTDLGVRFVSTREPGGTETGMAIRNILLDPRYHDITPFAELLLYIAARSQIVEQLIKPRRSEGYVVLCDRFIDSTTAYQQFGRGVYPQIITFLNQLATSNLKPDLTILLVVDPAKGKRRNDEAGKADRFDSEALKFVERVQRGYEWLAKQEPDRIKVVDANGSIVEVEEKVWAIVWPQIKKKGQLQITPLIEDDVEEPYRFRNIYICPKCGTKWEDEWSCMCDDDCLECGCRHISPIESVDLDAEEALSKTAV